LELLDFLSVQKRIYAKLTPLTPKIQAHDRVTEIGACLKKQAPIFCAFAGGEKRRKFRGKKKEDVVPMRGQHLPDRR